MVVVLHGILLLSTILCAVARLLGLQVVDVDGVRLTRAVLFCSVVLLLLLKLIMLLVRGQSLLLHARVIIQ